MKEKLAESLGTALPDSARSQAAASPVPKPMLENKTAPGQTGPRGTAPRTTYSRVNTGAPPTPIQGMLEQKSTPARGLEFLPAKVAHEEPMTDLAQRPTLNDMLKAAAAGTIERAQITATAARMAAGEESEKTASSAAVVDGGEHVPTAKVLKVASALAYIVDNLKVAETGNVQKPGEGPNALSVLEATSSEKNIDAGEGGQATSAGQPPMNPATQGEQVQSGKANTGLETNDGMQHSEQPTDPWNNQSASNAPVKGTMASDYAPGGKTASALETANLARLGIKTAQTSHFGGKKAPNFTTAQPGGKPPPGKSKSAAPIASIRKFAEDANNPAQISGGKATPPEASASEEGIPPKPSDHASQANMVHSNQGAIDYTKRQAKADPKSDVNQVLTQPALSASTDSVLQKTLDHTGEAGAKIASVQTGVSRTLAARALLSNMLEKVAQKNTGEEKKKEKSSMMGSAPATPSAASGFNASSVG